MLVFGTQMHLATFIFVSIEMAILFYLAIHKLARPDDRIVNLNIILIFLLIVYNLTGGLLPDPQLPGSYFIQEVIAYATGFITPCYFPYYVYKAFGLERLRFHAYKGVYLFLILPFFVFVVVFAVTGSLKKAEYLLGIPVLYALWVIISLIKAIREKYNNHTYSNKLLSEITVLLLSIIPWIGLPVVTYFNMGQTIEAIITNMGFLLLFGLQAKRNIQQARTEHEKLRESEKRLLNWNADLQEKVRQRTKELEKANEQKINNFINLVHEIKTPLTLVKNYLDEFTNQYGGVKEFDIIKGGVDKLAADVINLFDVERFGKGIDVYNHHQVSDFSNILKQNIILFERYCNRLKITCEMSIEENIFIKADPNAINRIINNIIENAIKYSKKGGKVVISLTGTGNNITFMVEDNGIGIDPDKQKRIFEPYFQINHKTTALQGVGLGLPIVNKVVDSLKGTICIESDPSIMPGTKVVITLEKHDRQQYDCPHRKSRRFHSTMYDLFEYDFSERTYDPGKKSILLMEDSKAMLHFLFTKLVDKYNVYYASNGIDGLKILRELTILPDLILSDIMMDKMDGFIFVRIISEQNGYNHIPVIFLTAKSTPADKMKGLNSGAIDYISKPFSFNLLNRKIENILNNIDKQHKAIINSTFLKFGYQMNGKGVSNLADPINFDQICKLHKLTNRETEIVKLLREGKSYKAIAEALFISDRTVTKHIQNIFEKAGVSNKIELINKLSQ